MLLSVLLIFLSLLYFKTVCWCRSRTCGRCTRSDAGISSRPETVSVSSMKTSWADRLSLFKPLFSSRSRNKRQNSSTRCLLGAQKHCTRFLPVFWGPLGWVCTRICTSVWRAWCQNHTPSDPLPACRRDEEMDSNLRQVPYLHHIWAMQHWRGGPIVFLSLVSDGKALVWPFVCRSFAELCFCFEGLIKILMQ